MKRVFFYVVIAIISSCADSTEKETILFRAPKNTTALEELIIRAEFYPLQTEKAPVVGADPQLSVLQDGSFVVLSRGKHPILHFAPNGKYLNTIGSQGSGPGEYLEICNIQIRGNMIVVFSIPDKVLYFESSGQLVREERSIPQGTQSFLVPEGILSYYGFGSGRDWRVYLWNKDNSEMHYLPTKANVIHLTAGAPLFSEHNTDVFFFFSYNPTIYRYGKGEVSPYLTFDFGKYAIQKDFFESEDAFESMEQLLSGEFAIIQRYLENDNYQLVEVFMQSPTDLKDYYGIKRHGDWIWVSAGNKYDSPFFHAIQWLDEEAMYCLVEPSRLVCEEGVFSDFTAKHTLGDSDNPVVVKLYLK